VRIGTVEEIVGRFTAASNATLLGRSGNGLVIYKPTAGVQPLWDFDVTTLAAREVLAHQVAEALGFAGLVPETVHGDGPFGPGAVQRYVPENPDFDPLPLIEAGDEILWPIAVLDLVIDNADRKMGHVLSDPTAGALRAVDHGLSLHPEPKLRTVLWAFAGEELPSPMMEALDRLLANVGPIEAEIATALGEMEATAFTTRLRRLMAHPVHPNPPEDRPAVPWPPF